MKWRHAAIVLVVLLIGVVRVAVGVPRAEVPSLALTGQVDIAQGPDGKLLVLMDEGTASQPSDGLVEHAFRLQGADAFTYTGRATITYTRGRLIVQPDGGAGGWVFDVRGRTLPPPEPGLIAAAVDGISHLWGETIHEPPATLFSTIAGGTCSMSSSAPNVQALSLDGGLTCTDCATGGPGFNSCAIDCDGSTCEADCASDRFACCGCSQGCGCCSSLTGGH